MVEMNSVSLPTARLDQIMACVTLNLLRIDPSVDTRFTTKTLLCDQVDVPLRPEDIKWPTDVQGTVLTVTDVAESYNMRPGQECRASLTYEVVGWIYCHDPQDTRKALRAATKDLWAAFWYDYYLRQADSQLRGSPGVQLVSNHRIERIERDYRPPEGFYRATVTCTYDFRVDATS